MRFLSSSIIHRNTSEMETKEQSSIAVINELFLYAQLQMQFTQQVFIELLGTKCYLKY